MMMMMNFLTGFSTLSLLASSTSNAAAEATNGPYFKRIATFNICEQLDPTCNTDIVTNAETVWYYENEEESLNLVYTNSENENLGFVDISDPTSPKANGEVDLGGEPTTVRVIGNYAVVGVNTSPDYINPTGKLTIIDTSTQEIVNEIELPGQPDAVDTTSSTFISGDTNDGPYYIVVAIENERDEDLGDGTPPQLPPGYISIIDIASSADLDDPTTWTIRNIELTNNTMVDDACLYSDDPEPEYVAINSENTKVVVSLQENNCFLIIDLLTGEIIDAYEGGSVTIDENTIDMIEDGIISSTESSGIELLREPDGITWIGTTNYFASANEGDLNGGSRGWTIFDSTSGDVVWDSGIEMELWTTRIGHYPESRSDSKGNEPENVLYSKMMNNNEYVFVLSERSNVVFVYDVTGDNVMSPKLLQILPAGVGPEGITVIASKNLVIVADEVDSRDDKIRSSLTIYQLDTTTPEEGSSVPEYPTLMSSLRDGEDTYIPFSALSGLAAAIPYGRNTTTSDMENILYTIEDSFYKKNRILTIDTSTYPAIVTNEKRIVDTTDVLMDCLTEFNSNNLAAATTDDATAVERQVTVNFVNITSVINDDDDKTVNIDPEGIAVISKDGGFWIVSEGSGTVGDEERPFETPNLLLKTNMNGEITQCMLLPEDGDWPDQVRYGFEGVATTEDNNHIVITIQRPWGNETSPRIAIYNTNTSSWSYVFYPLDDAESQNGGWVGLSDIAPLGSDGDDNSEFLILERDDQSGPDAAIKRIYKINLGDYSFEDGDVIEKTLVKDLLVEGDLTKMNGSIIEKVEGLAVTSSGKIWINTDNDGVDVGSGEQVLLNVGTYNGGSTTSTDNDDVEGTTTDDVDVDDSSSSSSSSGNAVSFEEQTIVLIAIVSSLSAIFAAFTES